MVALSPTLFGMVEERRPSEAKARGICGYIKKVSGREDRGLGKVQGEDAFDQDNGEQDSRPQDREQTCQLHRRPGSLDEREEKDHGEQRTGRLSREQQLLLYKHLLFK